MTPKDRRNHIDLPVLIAVLTLMVLSLGVVYSASATWAMQRFGESSHMISLHALRVLLGIIALFIGMAIDYTKMKRITKLVLIFSVVLLFVTLLFGGEMKGASRWLRFGGFGFQPSELAKLALLFHLSTLIAGKGELIKDFKRGFIPMMIWILGVTLLVLLQPNFSTGFMILSLGLIMLFVSRARIIHLAGVTLVALPLLVGYLLSASYRLERVRSFLEGGLSGGGMSYQLYQGIIGFGNGGLIGVGPGESRQRDLFLPESYGDFVFSIVGEEYGLIGTLIFMLFFLVIMLRGFKIAKYAPDRFSQLLAIAVTSMITLYALVNAGVSLGILPTTGLPMPFVSYGGSSLLFSSFAVGVLLNISSRTDLHPRATVLPDGAMPLEPLEKKVRIS